MIEIARQFGRYCYRIVATSLLDARSQVNDKRVDGSWKCEVLKVMVQYEQREAEFGLIIVSVPGINPKLKTTAGTITSYITVRTMVKLQHQEITQ